MTARKSIYRIMIIVVTALMILTFWSGGDVLAGDEIKINMNFKEADMGDVLRTIAEISGVNLVTDSSVNGKITVHLKEISFPAALDLITRTNQLAYRWNGESVVVASPRRIEEIYSKITTSIVSVDYARVEDLQGIVKGIYPRINVQLDRYNNKMIIQGNEEVSAEVIALIKRLDLPPKLVTRKVQLNIENPGKMQSLIRDFYPSLKLGEVLVDNQLIIQGSSEDIEGALALIDGFNQAPAERFIEIQKLENADPEMVKEHLLGFFPELLIQADQRNKQLLMAGRREELDRVRGLIRKLDTALPRERVEIVRIKYAELEGVYKRLSSVYPGVEVEVDEPNQQLIISGTESELEQAAALVARLDLPLEEKVLETVKLKFAGAESLAAKVKELYPETTIQVDENSKQLILLGKQEELARVQAFIKKIDIAPEEKIYRAVRIQGNPAEIAGLVKGIFADIQVEVDASNRQLVLFGLEKEVNGTVEFIKEVDLPRHIVTRSCQLENAEPAAVSREISGISPDLETRLEETTGKLYISGSQDEVDLAVSLVRKIEQENRISTELVAINYLDLAEIEPIISGLYPGLKLQLNKNKREIIITGKEEDVQAGVSFVKRIDTPSRQVIIEARFEEISRTELKNLGLYPDRLTEINFLKDGNGIIDGININWPEAIKALEESGKANTLANPRLMALNGEEARLLIGDRIPIVVEDIVEGKVARKIEYIEAGISLQFIPWITEDNLINLEVNPRVSSIGESLGSSLPPINTREVQTKIRLKDGETFAIGGLIQDDLIETVSRTPVLSEIPVLGQLFKQRRVNDIKTELIIFITPHIVAEKQGGYQEDLVGQNQAGTEETELNKDEREDSPVPFDPDKGEPVDTPVQQTIPDEITLERDESGAGRADEELLLLKMTAEREMDLSRQEDAGEMAFIKEENRYLVYQNYLRAQLEAAEEPEKAPERLPGRILTGEAELQLIVENNQLWE